MLDVRGLRLLAHKQPLSPKEWAIQIETRAMMIKPFLNFIPAQELQNVPCVYGDSGVESLSSLKFWTEGRPGFHVRFMEDKYPLTVQGMFRGTLTELDRLPKESCRLENKLVLWGLIRNSAWLSVLADLEIHPWSSSDKPDKLCVSATLLSVAIKETSPAELIKQGINPLDIFDWLSVNFTQWFSGYDERYWRARELAQMLEAEDNLINP